MQDHKKIFVSIIELIDIFKSLDSNMERTDIGYSEHRDYFDWIDSQINILEDCLFLLENKKSYATIFPALRVVFENYWIILLALNGEKYYKYFRVKEGSDKERIYQRWKREIEQLKQKNAETNILSVKKTKTRIVVCYKGLLDKNKNLIPWYYFLLKRYQPTRAHLGKEKRLIENYLIPPSLSNRFIQEQKDIRSDYFDLENGIFQHLILNSFINHKELQRLKVHYNFLSQWIHPNEFSLKISSLEYLPSVFGDRKKKDDFYLTRLALLYIGNLTKMFLESFLRFADRQIKENKIKEVRNRKEILEKINTFNSQTDYFWFIYNTPHYFYKYNYCINRMWRGSIMKTDIKHIMPEDLPDSLIPYYSDPIDMLKKASQSLKNPLCGDFITPIQKEN